MHTTSLPGLTDLRRSSRYVTRTLVLVATVIAVTLGAAIAAMAWVSHVADGQEARHKAESVSRALRNEQSQNIAQLQGLTASSALRWALQNRSSSTVMATILAQDSRKISWFDGVYIVDPQSNIRAGIESGAPAGQAGFDGLRHLVGPIVQTLISTAMRDNGDDISRDVISPYDTHKHALSNIYFDGQTLVSATALPIIIPGSGEMEEAEQTVIVVAYKALQEREIKAFAQRQGIVGLRIVRPDTTETALNLTDYRGNITGALTWANDRPGGDMLSTFIAAMVCAVGLCLVMFVTIVVRLRRSALHIAMQKGEIERLAGHDPLSGLPNRRVFELAIDVELAKITTSGGGFAVHFLDLDKFKAVNDTYGHKAGDELIRQVAKRLTDLLRGADTLVRFGGDEFAIIQTEVVKSSEAAILGKRVLEALTRPFAIGDVHVSIGVSVGISLAPFDGTDRETLAHLADTALYQAKNEGRNRFNFFERQMDNSVRLRQIVENDLRKAIDEDELELHYQPQTSADGRTIVGIEALVRWPHKTHGMISPAEFIPVAEERGLIMQLSDWVLRRACTDGLRWPGLRVAVNVSPIQFRHPGFVANVAKILQETGFDGSRLELELTEGVVVEDADKAEAAMFELRTLGVGLALDDFGTGYSSLIYLRRFAFDKIKIDRSFLEYMETTGESAILVHSVVHLGRALGLRVCAEGVETAEQHRFLQAVGCHEMQGFYFSRPLPRIDLDKLLAMTDPFAQHASA